MPHKTIIRLSGVARNPANGFPARLLGWRNSRREAAWPYVISEMR